MLASSNEFSYIFLIFTTNVSMGGDLGGLGDGTLPNLRWGAAHASVPPIVEEIVL